VTGVQTCALPILGMANARSPLRRIASLHNVPEHDLCDPARWDPNPLDRRRRMAALRRFDAITVLQPEFREWFPAGLREKVAVVPNVVKPVMACRAGRAARETTVLSVGRLAGARRHDGPSEAWARLTRASPDRTRTRFGKGPLEAELKAQVEKLGLSGKVRLMGHTAAIEEEYLKASLLVHPAKHEGWGLAASE